MLSAYFLKTIHIVTCTGFGTILQQKRTHRISATDSPQLLHMIFFFIPDYPIHYQVVHQLLLKPKLPQPTPLFFQVPERLTEP